MDANRSRWASRFIGATFVLGGIAWAIIAVLVLGNVLAGMGNYTLGPASSRIVAGGGGGGWFSMGVPADLPLRGAGNGGSGPLFQHLEATPGPPLAGWRDAGA